MNPCDMAGRRWLRLSAHRGFARHFAIANIPTLLCWLSLSAMAADPVDWYQWRGPEGNGISREKNLPVSWSPAGDGVAWVNDAYGSRCTPIVMNGKIYVVTRYKPETTEEGESVVCINAQTGEKIWETHHNVFLTDSPAERVGWSSVVGDPITGNIYWLGLGCEFLCLKGDTGEIKWQHALSEEYGMLSTYGGRTNFPIVFEDLVIISGVMTQWGTNAVPAHRFIGFDKNTGGAVWFSSTTPKPMDTTYSTPFLTAFDGQAAIVFGCGDGKLHAMQPRTGKIIWSYFATTRGIFTSPVVVDNIVYCGFHEQSAVDPRIRGGLFAFDGRTQGEVKEEQLLWKIDSVEIAGGQPIVLDGRLYVVDIFGKLLVVDTKTGEEIFSRKVGRRPGDLVYGDGKLYCTESTGLYWVFEPSPEGVNEIAKVRMNNEEILAATIIAGGKLYITTGSKMICVGDKAAKPEADPLPAPPQESPVAADQEIAQIQIAPVEAMLAPGQSTPYQVRAYNKNGQYLKVIDAEFEVEGGGEIEPDGTYTAPVGNAHTAVFITAKSGEISSTARARIIPPLPWKFDFSDGQVPITWIGAAYRHQPKEVSGEPALVKISTIPLGTRSQSWMGWTTLHDYTIQADVYSTKNEINDRADMGLINQRYTLDLMNKNELEIRSWASRLKLRFAESVPFEWAADTWYTLKFQSETNGGKVTLRGKAWKRGEAEPAEWTIEATDALPNVSGSPGMFGNSGNSEFYIDNVEVYKNK